MQFNAKQKQRIKRISLTPLIDVVFLLLIFFMLSSTFLKFVNIPVNGGQAAPGNALGKDKLIIIRLKIGDTLEVNGEAVTLESLTEKLNALNEKGQVNAVIKPEDGTKVQRVITILEQARRSKLKKIMLVQ